MSLQFYEGVCGQCGQKITWVPVGRRGDYSGRQTYEYAHAGMLLTVKAMDAPTMDAIGYRLHDENQDS